MSKVSIIITTYNRADYLRLCIESVIKQTHCNFELIIIDDGSDDNTKEIVNSFHSSKIKYLYQENSGQNSAKNRGLLIAEGEYITILDSDDIISPHKIWKQSYILDKMPDVGVVYCGTRLIDNRGKVLGYQKLIVNNGDVLQELLMKNFLYNGSNAMFRKECLEKAGIFDYEVNRMTDWDLYLRFSLFYKFHCIEDYLLDYRVHESNMSCDYKKYEEACFTIIDRIFAHDNFPILLNPLKNKAVAYRYKYLSGRCLENGEISKGKSYLFRAIKVAPDIILNLNFLKMFLITNISPILYRFAKKVIMYIRRWSLRDENQPAN